MANWYIGCSGFYYDDWKEFFYPKDVPKKQWFEYYCKHFNTLELNVTFYRFPQLPAMQSWYKRSPEGFKFAVKAPKAITHFKKFEGIKDMLADFYKTSLDGLQEKLGCVLFQLPPRYGYTEERLEKIIAAVDKSFANVIEFRDNSWWTEEVYNELSKQNITFCGISHPTLPDDAIINTPLAYYRFHGVPQLYVSPYPKTFLKKIADTIKADKSVKEVYIYFNNTDGGAALDNGKTMRGIVGKK